MASEMIARVARAIDLVTTAYNPHRTDQELLEKCARAAIEAMREPTREMLEAGAKGSGEDSETSARGAWESMIDAAVADDITANPVKTTDRAIKYDKPLVTCSSVTGGVSSV